MSKVTPCGAGYNCPYCRQIDENHIISMFPQCPIRWIKDSDDVFDTLTGQRMPFVKRPELPKRKDDDRHFDLIPIFETSGGGKRRQKGLFRI